MSDNPFQPPTTTANPDAGPRNAFAMPGSLKVLCILCIIFGAFGLLGSLAGAAALMFQSQISEAQQAFGDPAQQAMQAKIAEMQSQQFVPNLLMVVFNLVVASMLLLGAIGVLSRKSWGPKIFGKGLITAAVFVVIRAAVTLFMQMGIMDTMGEFFAEQTKGQPQAETMEAVMIGSMYVGFAVAIAWALALAGFYFWGWRHLKKDRSQAFFQTFASDQVSI